MKDTSASKELREMIQRGLLNSTDEDVEKHILDLINREVQRARLEEMEKMLKFSRYVNDRLNTLRDEDRS